MLAALANATAGVALEVDEGNRWGGGHPSIHVMPAALAVAEELEADGARFIEALIAGYEVTSRLGGATRQRANVHSHGTWGTAGAAVAVARLRGHEPRALRDVINLATSMSPANTWTPENLATLVERLGGAIVVTHSQSGIMGHHMTRILKERGHLDLLKGLLTLEGSCSLSNSGLTAADFDNIPYMALKGDYTATSTVCQETVDAINARRAAKQGTAKAEYLKLDDMGILGVTHMMMLDKKNLEIADIIYNWIGRNVPAGGNRRGTN